MAVAKLTVGQKWVRVIYSKDRLHLFKEIEQFIASSLWTESKNTTSQPRLQTTPKNWLLV